MMRTSFSPTLLDKKQKVHVSALMSPLGSQWCSHGYLYRSGSGSALRFYDKWKTRISSQFYGLIDESIDFQPHSVPSIHLVLLSILDP
jgi:hypothetical protein